MHPWRFFSLALDDRTPTKACLSTNIIHMLLLAAMYLHLLLPPLRLRQWTVVPCRCAPPFLLAHLSPLSILFISPLSSLLSLSFFVNTQDPLLQMAGYHMGNNGAPFCAYMENASEDTLSLEHVFLYFDKTYRSILIYVYIAL